MKTKVIKDTHIKGNLDFDGKIVFKNFCIVDGYIRAQSIESDGSIESGGYIESSGSIKSGRYIESGEYIESDGSIRSGEYIFSFTFSIVAKYIITKTLPLGRYFWAEMPPLRKWKKEIQTIGLCWDDYRQMITRAEAEKICSWQGWHWILRAHLEMFLRLKKKYEIKKEEK